MVDERRLDALNLGTREQAIQDEAAKCGGVGNRNVQQEIISPRDVKKSKRFRELQQGLRKGLNGRTLAVLVANPIIASSARLMAWRLTVVVRGDQSRCYGLPESQEASTTNRSGEPITGSTV